MVISVYTDMSATQRLKGDTYCTCTICIALFTVGLKKFDYFLPVLLNNRARQRTKRTTGCDRYSYYLYSLYYLKISKGDMLSKKWLYL